MERLADDAVARLVESGLSPEVVATVTARGNRRGRGLVTAHAGDHTLVGPPDALSGLDRIAREELLAATLATGATMAHGAGSRAVSEEPDPWRTCFEKDRDRVKYSNAFRRLAGKCQVFVAPKDDHLRNRMTHALEVAQVATAVASAVRLNVALAEAIALAHDCGHGPTGHASEDAFSIYLPEGYDHAPYGADVVLAPLNLCAEVLDGVRNHSWKRPAPSTPEAELVAICDRVAYVCHDFQDAVRAGIVTPEQLPPLVRSHAGVTQSDQLGYFISSMIETVLDTGHVGLDEEAAAVLDEFRSVNFERIYLRPASREQADRSIVLLRGLVDHFIDRPGQLPDVAAGLIEHPGGGTETAARLAIRYVSGMTDRYALNLGRELLGLGPDQLPRGV